MCGLDFGVNFINRGIFVSNFKKTIGYSYIINCKRGRMQGHTHYFENKVKIFEMIQLAEPEKVVVQPPVLALDPEAARAVRIARMEARRDRMHDEAVRKAQTKERDRIQKRKAEALWRKTKRDAEFQKKRFGGGGSAGPGDG